MRTEAQIQADIAMNKAAIGTLRAEQNVIKDKARDERWEDEQKRAIIDRKAYALELAKETIPPMNSKRSASTFTQAMDTN